MFSLIQGNRQDVLAALLAARLRAAPPDVFSAEIVVVQSEAMERWLRLFLAESLGIAAQLRFPFPAGYIWELFGAVLPDVPEQSPFAAERLHWRLLRMLGQPRSEAVYAPLNHYLANADMDRRDGLAERLATCFEAYLAYRPDWVAAWEKRQLLDLGPHEAWQAALWRELLAELPNLPTVHPKDAFFDHLQRQPNLRQRLPQRISLFGVGAMPPAYLDVFRSLGQYCEVTLYLHNPCREHWGDLVSRRVLARAALEQPEAVPYLTEGNPLLGSLGGAVRQFIDLATMGAEAQIDAFAEPDVDQHTGHLSLLGQLQFDMLTLADAGSDRPPHRWQHTDDSLQLHLCHSAMREVDVLHDRLLNLFETRPGLLPSDVMVLCPDLATYGPLIEARFGSVGRFSDSSEHREISIPYTIADLPPSREAPLQRAFTLLLNLASGRLDAESVLNLLEQAPVARRFDLDEAGLERARRWVGAAAIRWGVDAPWRLAQDLPEQAAHSWRAGFERLLLGLAMAPEAGLFQGQLAAAEIEGSAAQDLGNLISFGEALFAAYAALNQPHTLPQWALLLQNLLFQFCQAEPGNSNDAQFDANAERALRAAFQHVAQMAAGADCAEAVPLSVVRRAFESGLEATAPGWRFLGGGVTFAALRPHRAVPMKVVCLLGMNDGVFPRNPAQPGFDLMTSHPRAGDRATRAEDRHAFLEVLLSARDVLHISYLGRGIRDNAPLPPSALVSELTDAVQRSFRAENSADGRDLLRAITVDHPLQAFNRRYFSGEGRLYCYQTIWADACQAALQARLQGSPLLTGSVFSKAENALVEHDSTRAETLDVDALIRFLVNPARTLLQHGLGIQLWGGEEALSSSEPFLLDSLQRYQLDQTIVAAQLAGQNEAQALAMARASGELPHGVIGDSLFISRWQTNQHYARSLRQALSSEREPLAVDVALTSGSSGIVRLSGELHGLTDSGLIDWRPAKDARGKDLLRLWVKHLLLHVCAPEDVPRSSHFHATNGVKTLRPLATREEALNQLQALVALWQRGRHALLPFFPDTALALARGKNPTPVWLGGPSDDAPPPESSDVWFDLAFAHVDPLQGALGADLQALSEQIYRPLLAVLEGEKVSTGTQDE